MGSTCVRPYHTLIGGFAKMLTPEKHCEFLSANVRDRAEAMRDGFKLYVQLYSAIVGGSLVLRLQYGGQIPSSIVSLSNWLATLVAAATLALVIDAFRAWKGQRTRLSEVAARDESGKLVIPEPNLWTSGITFAVMVLAIIAGPILFCIFNPLRI
jgi:hypothetical protein